MKQESTELTNSTELSREKFSRVTLRGEFKEALRTDNCRMNLTAAQKLSDRGLVSFNTARHEDISQFDEIQLESTDLVRAGGVRELDIDGKTAIRLSDGRRGWRVSQFANEKSYRLVCYPRSGSTWLRLMLTYLYTWEFPNSRRCAERLLGSDQAELIRWSWHVVPHLYSKQARIKGGPFPKLIPKIYRVHRNNFTIRHPKVVYMLRDGRDTTSSFRRLEAARGRPTESVAAFLSKDNQAPGGWWWGHVREWLVENSHPNLLVVKYEALKEQPETELKKVADFLQINTTDSVIEKAVAISQIGRIRPVWNSTVEKTFVGSGEVGSWQETFTEEDKQAFKEGGQAMLEQLDYAKDDKW